MNDTVISRLNALNRAFYRVAGEDFDQTRGKPWPGWARIVPYVRQIQPLRVLDVGCGNGRFGVFLAKGLGESGHSGGLNPPLPLTIEYHGLDSDKVLLRRAGENLAEVGATGRSPLQISLERRDVLENPPDAGEYDLVALLGVLHHVPGAAGRRELIRALAKRVAPGGLLAFSCWRFYEYERFRERIVPWPGDLAGEVEAGDYLLDWRRGNKALRYCHYADDTEHAALIEASGLAEVESYRADGKTGDTNRYSLLRRQGNS